MNSISRCIVQNKKERFDKRFSEVDILKAIKFPLKELFACLPIALTFLASVTIGKTIHFLNIIAKKKTAESVAQYL